MSQQCLYQVLGLSGYGVTKLERDEKRLLVHCQPQPHRICCPGCQNCQSARTANAKSSA
jgi:hypothetical protein